MTFLEKSWSEYFLWEFNRIPLLMTVFPGLQIQRIINKWFCARRVFYLLCFSTGWGINSIVKSKPNDTLLHVKSNDYYKIQEKTKTFVWIRFSNMINNHYSNIKNICNFYLNYLWQQNVGYRFSNGIKWRCGITIFMRLHINCNQSATKGQSDSLFPASFQRYTPIAVTLTPLLRLWIYFIQVFHLINISIWILWNGNCFFLTTKLNTTTMAEWNYIFSWDIHKNKKITLCLFMLMP